MRLIVTNDKSRTIKWKYDGNFIICDPEWRKLEREVPRQEMALGLRYDGYREGTEVYLLSGEKVNSGSQSFRIYPDGQIALKPIVVGWRDSDRKLVWVNPTDKNVVRLDMDYLRSMQLENEKKKYYFEL